MLESIPVILIVSAVLGFLAGIGVGGGSLLILWLTLCLDYPQPHARFMNLLFFIPSALIASIFRWKQGNISIKKILPAVLAGCVSAAGASLIAGNMDMELLRKLFGILLLATGGRELLYKPKQMNRKM